MKERIVVVFCSNYKMCNYWFKKMVHYLQEEKYPGVMAKSYCRQINLLSISILFKGSKDHLEGLGNYYGISEFNLENSFEGTMIDIIKLDLEEYKKRSAKDEGDKIN